jgi:PBP1b-binding outer membrane lipoprotein LpoB
MKIISAVILAALLTGCAATQQEMAHEEKMVDKHLEAQKSRTPVPIFALEAHEGQTISMSGVKSIRVYDPAANAPIPQLPQRKTGAEVAWDGVTKTLGIVTDPLVTLGMHQSSQTTARKQISANVEMQKVNMGTLGAVAEKGFTSIQSTGETAINAVADTVPQVLQGR